ncbi:hypothetical protein IKF30_02880 [Candidatus Saccharibacteria bacterium]|nr:hypothetical protein [Candidatus Saccharibacteria bacterium]
MDNGKNSKSGQSQPNPRADAWDSLLGSAQSIEDNFKDDEDYINHKRQFGYDKKAKARDIAERRKVRDEERATLDAYQTQLERTQNRTAGEYNKQHTEDFIGETNLNSKTGKQRSYKWMDLYPIMQREDENGQSVPESGFGERTRRRNDLTVLTEYIPKLPDETPQEYSQRVDQVYTDFPRQESETLDHYKERIETAHENNEILSSIANHMVDPDSDTAKQLKDDLANIDDMKQFKHINDIQAKQFQREVLQRAIDRQAEINQANARAAQRELAKERLANKKKLELETKNKLELEEKAKLEAMERQKLENEAKMKQNQEAIDEIDQELGPLAAINANFTHDKKELAHDYAERELNAENAKSRLLKRIWKGNLFKKYYEKKYEREILEGKREVTAEDGSRKKLDAIIAERSSSAITRFTLAATEEYGEAYIHDKAGEAMPEADKRTTEVVKAAIEKFATAKIPEGGSLTDLIRDFNNDVEELKAEARDSGTPLNETLIDNYLDVAKEARMRAEHGIAIERIMEGFKVYNAEVRNNVRTEAHRDNIDKIVNKLESSKIGSVVPPEILAAAVGTASVLTQTGARAIAGAVGGIGLSGVFAGLKERNRVTEDRARKMRDVAVGLEYNSGDGNRAARKRARYEARLGGTLYDARPAQELTEHLNAAIESKNPDAIISAIAEARVRIDYSDSENKDLITYTSADALGDERTRLDIAIIRAEHSLPEEQQSELQLIKDYVKDHVDIDVSQKDRAFRKLRTAQAIKQAGKTVAIGSAFFLGSQEIMATFDPNKISLLEKAGILKTQNNEEVATETILARLAGPRVKTETYTDVVRGIRADQDVEINRLKQNGYTQVVAKPAHTEIKTDYVDIPPAQSAHAIKVNTQFADNGTRIADGNELGLRLENGNYVARMTGDSTMGSQVFNYEQLAADGVIKAQINIGGANFDIAGTANSAGQFTWPVTNGTITTTTGEVIQAFGANGEKLFKTVRVVVDNGFDADGVNQVVSLATDVGRDTFNGTITEAVESIVEEPAVYNFIKTTVSQIPRDVTYAGIILPITSRTGLGEARPVERSTTFEEIAPTPIEAATIEAPAPQTASESTETSTPQTAPEPAANPTPQASSEPSDSSAPGVSVPPQTPPEATDAGSEAIRTVFLDLVGEDGVKFMTDISSHDDDGLEESFNDDVTQWWNSLSQDAKNEVITFERINKSSKAGRALRTWLELQGVTI